MIFFNKNSGKVQKKDEEKRVWDLDETSDYPSIFNPSKPQQEPQKKTENQPDTQDNAASKPSDDGNKLNGLANGGTRSGMFGGTLTGKHASSNNVEHEKNSNNLEMAKKFLEMSGTREKDGSYSKVPYSPVKNVSLNKVDTPASEVEQKDEPHKETLISKQEKMSSNGVKNLYAHGTNYSEDAYNNNPRPDREISKTQDKDVMTIQEASAFFGVSVSTFRKILKEENVPARKIGRSWRFSRQALINWIEQGKSIDYKKEQEKPQQ